MNGNQEVGNHNLSVLSNQPGRNSGTDRSIQPGCSILIANCLTAFFRGLQFSDVRSIERALGTHMSCFERKRGHPTTRKPTRRNAASALSLPRQVLWFHAHNRPHAMPFSHATSNPHDNIPRTDDIDLPLLPFIVCMGSSLARAPLRGTRTPYRSVGDAAMWRGMVARASLANSGR
jgi:hypothetical protein